MTTGIVVGIENPPGKKKDQKAQLVQFNKKAERAY